jgi:hypothetical protein
VASGLTWLEGEWQLSVLLRDKADVGVGNLVSPFRLVVAVTVDATLRVAELRRRPNQDCGGDVPSGEDMTAYSTDETTLSTLERDSIAATVAQWVSDRKRAGLVLIGHSPGRSISSAFPAFPTGTRSREVIDAALGGSAIVERAICVNANAKIYRQRMSRSGFEYVPAELRLLELVKLLAPETQPYKTMFVTFGTEVLSKFTRAIWKHFEVHPARPVTKEILNWKVSPNWLCYERLNLSLLGMYHPAADGFEERLLDWAAAIKRLTVEVS